MSLDVYLRLPNHDPASTGSGIFVRENGSTVEISREEWDQKFPGREPVVLRGEETDNEVFSANVTHNLNRMASAAGIYEALWRPAELDPDRSARIKEQQEAGNYHGPNGAYAIEAEVTIHARDLIEPLIAGLARLREDPAKFEALNPDNGWGSYEAFVPWVERYLHACQQYPDAEVDVSR